MIPLLNRNEKFNNSFCCLRDVIYEAEEESILLEIIGHLFYDLLLKMATQFRSFASYLGLRNFFRRNLNTSTKAVTGSSVDAEEIRKFTGRANEWWSGTYNALQSMNTLRVPLVRDGILYASGITAKKSYPLEGYNIIDIGCGGGLLCEPLARLGATVTGLDPGEENIAAATEHAVQDHEIKDRLNFVCDTVENFATISAGKFDAVVCSEVVEHVADVQSFVTTCVELTKDGGSLFFTTINRTTLSYLAAILAGEYILNIIPRGTHDWNKFVQPKELSDILKASNCHIVSVNGMFYNPLTKNWSWCRDSSSNYALHAIK
ncbi:ubiquinone biosynthesis O-methyltransferase, mitochondrial [Nephila pilipes]|uniref:Ubiquinone biosynthesis O-methyltransferase, mitochondrial n=1 Tax=Nephila pilipes TaxID=299642 RepID=A0A8X6NFJ8_NEPPI|nr:ubiquinone biosynthesis O-methyltransferase, mitochondrial [Nephila pilipes]